MARSLTANQQTLADASGLTRCELIQIDFDTPMYLTTAGRNVTYDSKTWLGDGTLLEISDIQESLDLQAHALQLVLAGSSSLVSLALNGQGKGKRVRLWVAFINAAGAVEGSPVLEADMMVDTMPVMDGVSDQ